MEALREMANERERRRLAQLGVAPARVAEIAALVAGDKIAAEQGDGQEARRSASSSATPGRAGGDGPGLIQASDTGAIDAAIDALLAENPTALQDYKRRQEGGARER